MKPTKVRVGTRIIWDDGTIETVIAIRKDGLEWRVDDEDDTENDWWEAESYKRINCRVDETSIAEDLLKRYESR